MKYLFIGEIALAMMLLPMAVGADSMSDFSLYNEKESPVFSSALSSEGMGESTESTLYFNDGFGRMTEFHMIWEGRTMTLTIRQNMSVVWKEQCSVKQDNFSVVRREEMGEVYFLITMGDHHYRGEITRDDRWEVREEKGSFLSEDDALQILS